MAIPTVTVSIAVAAIMGTGVPHARLTFELTAADVDGGIVAPAPVTATCDENGAGSVQLWSNARGLRGTQYRVTLCNADGELQYTGVATVPVNDCNLHEILELVAPPQVDDAQAAATAAQGHAAAAAASSGAAADSADAALQQADAAAASASAAAASSASAAAASAQAIADAGVSVTNVVDTLSQISGRDFGELQLSVLDEGGLLSFGVNADGDLVAPAAVVDELTVQEITDAGTDGDHYNYEFAIADEAGNVVFGIIDGAPTTGETTTFDLDAMQAYADGLNVSVMNNLDGAALVWDYNHVIGNGQSNMVGHEAWPAKSVAARLGNLMFGGCVRPAAMFSTSFTPIGSATLQPLVANVNSSTDGVLLSDAEVAALAPGAMNYGECPVVALANGLKRSLNDALQTLNDGRALVVSNVAVGGRTVEELSKGSGTGYYGRYTSVITQVKAITDAASKTYGVAIVALAQGEDNYTRGDTTLEGYKAKFIQWVDDMAADAKALTGQTREPIFLTYQVGHTATKDNVEMSIGMAQWRATKERANLYMVAPVYPVTNKGVHLDANGSRWLGWYFAKAAMWAAVHRKPWRPLEPVEIQQDGKLIYVSFRVPRPPLRFDSTYVGHTATDYPAKGFRVTDGVGAVGISAVDIVSPNIVRITCTTEPSGTAYVWYASETTYAGNGNLCDSDDTVVDDVYAYTAGSGDYATHNVAALVDKKYPLANWCVAFRLAVGFKEQA